MSLDEAGTIVTTACCQLLDSSIIYTAIPTLVAVQSCINFAGNMAVAQNRERKWDQKKLPDTVAAVLRAECHSERRKPSTVYQRVH